MAAIRQQINGNLINIGDRSVLWLDEQEKPVYLCYALIVRETELELYPESLLDDWGYEIRSLELYNWIQENGFQFPRAEIFGFDGNGIRKQYFLRELDLMARFPCYAFEGKHSPVTDGVQVSANLIPNHHLKQPQRIKCPPEIEGPMRNAKVSWWQVPVTDLMSLDLKLISSVQD